MVDYPCWPYDFFDLYFLFMMILAIGAVNRASNKELANAGNELTTSTDVFTEPMEYFEPYPALNESGTGYQKSNFFDDFDNWVVDRFNEFYYFTDGYGYCPEYFRPFCQGFDNTLYDFADSLFIFYWECLWVLFFFVIKPIAFVFCFFVEGFFEFLYY
jgi:hypothetical protein